MVRVLVTGMLTFFAPLAMSAQPLGTLHIRVAVQDAEGKPVPAPRYGLLISDNPPTAAPRRVETGRDGTTEVRLRPGNYTVESDAPLSFRGRSYSWTLTVDVAAAGGDAVLELTTANAEVEAPRSESANPATPLEIDPIASLGPWRDSVVALWTPSARGSGFVTDVNGLIATSQQVVGASTSIEVQFGPALKVTGRVVAADRMRDVALVQVDRSLVASVQPVAVKCGEPAPSSPVQGQKIFAIGVPMGEPKDITSGTVTRVEGRALLSDVVLAAGAAGGPVFARDGALVGITTDVPAERRRKESGIAGVTDLCAVIAAAEKTTSAGTAPPATRLPVEPTEAFPAEALKDAAQRGAGSLAAYQMSSSDFDIAFITPQLAYAAQHRSSQTRSVARDPLTDFGNWSEYVEASPPVLLVRVTPRLVEGFWTTVARGAAQTQGMALPPIKHFKSGFSRLRALCGGAEVTPIHPLTIEQRVSETDAIREGLYVFDPSALGPRCGTVTIVLYSEKEPNKGDSRVVDPKLVERISQDLAPAR